MFIPTTQVIASFVFGVALTLLFLLDVFYLLYICYLPGIPSLQHSASAIAGVVPPRDGICTERAGSCALVEGGRASLSETSKEPEVRVLFFVNVHGSPGCH